MTAAPRLEGWSALPAPPARRGDGHLGEWARRPLPLLEEGARRAREEGRDLFGLRLGLPAVVGISPGWNRLLLTDLATFRSAGSFPRLVPHLSGGVVVLDAPGHRSRRQALVPAFGPQALGSLRARTAAALEDCPLPPGDFDALAWADRTVRTLLNAVYFSGEFPDPLLHAFLAPLRRPFPVPALPRPLLFRRVDAELRRLARRRGAHHDDLLAVLARLPGGLEETRVSLAAAHDTTTHALAYALWLLARHPQWHAPEHHPAVLKETLRLYPPGWIGSRRLARDLDHGGVWLPRGTLALYSAYLSGRDPALWDAPEAFCPERWQARPPAWAYLPFGGGERICLGTHLAQLLILAVLGAVPPLQAVRGDAAPVAAVTLGPRGPLIVRRRG